MCEPDWSDSESVTHEFVFSDDCYSNDEENKNSGNSGNSGNYVIDMDSELISAGKAKTTIKSIPKIINNETANKATANKATANKALPTKIAKTIDLNEITIAKTSETRKIIKKKANSEADTKDTEKHNSEKKEAGKKELKADIKFEFNEETIEFFSKDILADVNKICVVNSAFKNDTALLCLLLKLGIIKEYKCSTKKCKIGKTWLDKPIQLLIHRKNGKITDLTQNNIELMCPNCYIAKYGLDIFQKVINQTTYICKLCNYPLSGFSNSKKKERYCMACESRIMNYGYYDKQTEFITELKETIDNSSSLRKDEFTTSNYYSEVSQYKNFDSSNTSKNNDNKTGTGNKANNAPIINLNMTVPDLDELIDEF
jgi:hypothetical protein